MRTASTLALLLALGSSSAGCLLVNDYDRFSRGGGADGGVTDAAQGVDGCVPTGDGETCNGGDDDCDGTIDESPRDCGEEPNQAVACVSRACQVTGCVDGWDDCTSAPGCETAISGDRAHCGVCGNVCGAIAVCRDRSCATLDADWLVHGSSPTRTWLSGVAVRGEHVVAVGSHPSSGLTLGGELVSSDAGAFVTVRSRAGAQSRRLSLAGAQVALHRVVVNASDVIYVSGEYRMGVLPIGGTELPDTEVSAAFVAAFTADLEPSWVVRVHGTGPVLPTGLALDAGSSGVWFSASYGDGVSVDGESYDPHGHGAAVMHLDGGGAPSIVRVHRWTRDTTDADVFSPLPSGGYVLGGFVMASEAFAPSMTTNPYRPTGIDAFVVSYDAGGNMRWLHTLPTEGESYTLALAATEDTVYAGVFVDGASGAFMSQGGLLALDATDGSARWQRPLGGGVETIHAIAVAPDGDVVVGGMAHPGVNIGTGTPNIRGIWDAMIARVGPDGTSTRWLYTFGGSGRELVSALALGASDEVYAAGQFDGSIQAAGATWNAAGTDSPDGFLLRLTP